MSLTFPPSNQIMHQVSRSLFTRRRPAGNAERARLLCNMFCNLLIPGGSSSGDDGLALGLPARAAALRIDLAKRRLFSSCPSNEMTAQSSAAFCERGGIQDASSAGERFRPSLRSPESHLQRRTCDTALLPYHATSFGALQALYSFFLSPSCNCRCLASAFAYQFAAATT